MKHHPYSKEWTRQKYLSEAVTPYFTDDEGVEPFLEDLRDILSEWLAESERRSADMKTLLKNF